MNETAQNIYVIGHRNPDTDSICSAIAYADLKNKAENTDLYIPCRAGELGPETIYALKRFNAEAPMRCVNVKPTVRDIEIHRAPGVPENTTIQEGLQIMREEHTRSQAVTDENGVLKGLITVSDIAKANMENLDSGALAKAKTPVANIVKTLNGTVLAGSSDWTITEGNIMIGAGSPEAMESMAKPGDILMVANRYESQLCAIELGASCVIVCMGSTVARTIVMLAAEKHCTLISTPYDTYAASSLIKLSAPIGAYMTPADKLTTVNIYDAVDDVRKKMSQVRFVYFPVLSHGKYIGLLSRRNLLNLQRRRMILVDHNEKTQCVEGYDETEILEIIDHHRIGNLETGAPVYFRNQPVGCTATIITAMYREQGIEIAPDIAGLMLCAILSDTLAFRSPTCTPVDVRTAHELAALAGVDPNQLAEELFEAGENLNGRSAETVCFQDFKVFTHGELRFGVGQGSYMNRKNLNRAEELLTPYLETARIREGVQMMFFMLTDVAAESSKVLCCGEGAEDLLEASFGIEKTADGYILPGVVSRKKQLIPVMLATLQQG